VEVVHMWVRLWAALGTAVDESAGPVPGHRAGVCVSGRS